MPTATLHRSLASLALVGLLAAGCSGSDDDRSADPDATDTTTTTTTSSTSTTTSSSSSTTSTTTTSEPPSPVLRVLVTNDDGVGSEGIDAVVEALRTIDDVELTVVAPAENQSGTSDTVSDPAPTTATETTTASGFPALAVAGTPADAVNHALTDVFTEPPHLVVSGSNEGQNIGPFASLSGTVGAVRTAARHGVPGLAISQGAITTEPEFEVGIPFLVDWLTANRAEVLGFDADLGVVWSLNVPSCAGTGALRGLLEGLPLATEFADDENPLEVDCGSNLADPDDDATAFLNGYATLTLIPEELVVTTSG